MPFTGQDLVWAHADSYPQAISCDDHIGRMRNYKDMTCMMSSFNYKNGMKNNANSTTRLKFDETETAGKANNGNVGDVSSSAARSAYDFVINNVGYEDSNTPRQHHSGNAYNVPINAKKRLINDAAEVPQSKRACFKESAFDCEEMEIDAGSISTDSEQPTAMATQSNNFSSAARSTITATDNVPTQAHLQYQAHYKPPATTYSIESRSGNEACIWQNNIPESINNRNSTNKFRQENIESFLISCDDIEFMYQATHGGSLARQSHCQYDDNL